MADFDEWVRASLMAIAIVIGALALVNALTPPPEE